MKISVLYSLLFFLVVCSAITCSPSNGNSQNNENGISENDSSNEDEITIQANFSMPVMLTNDSMFITNEITYRNNIIIREKFISKSGDLTFGSTQEFDEKQRLKSFISEKNGEKTVMQTNTFTEDDLLLSEFRVEKNYNKYDTILYEYHYPKERPNPMHYYRTNNGIKVTEITLTKSGRNEVVYERSCGNKKYIGITKTTSVKNDKGKIIKKQEVIINSDWDDKTKLDTTICEPIYYEYDEEGRVTSQKGNTFIGGGDVEIFYNQHGLIREKIFTKQGEKPITIIYKKIYRNK